MGGKISGKAKVSATQRQRAYVRIRGKTHEKAIKPGKDLRRAAERERRAELGKNVFTLGRIHFVITERRDGLKSEATSSYLCENFQRCGVWIGAGGKDAGLEGANSQLLPARR